MNAMYKSIGLLGILLFGQLLQAQELLDPRLRDDSIGDTEIAVEVETLPSGIYQYTYKLTSSNENKGRILNFSLSIDCKIALDETGMPVAQTTKTYMGDASNGEHLPVVFDFSASQYAYFHGIGPDNTAHWLVGMNPGETSEGLRLFSPAPPQQIPYTLTPSMDTEGWDYSSYEEDDLTVPWIEDFTVTGMTEGPGCPTEAPPSR